MGETELLLWETARVAGAEAMDAARGATDPDAAERCRRIADEARARLGIAAGTGEPPSRPATPDMGVHRAAIGMVALGGALARCPDADADARALASRLLVLLRALQEEIIATDRARALARSPARGEQPGPPP